MIVKMRVFGRQCFYEAMFFSEPSCFTAFYVFLVDHHCFLSGGHIRKTSVFTPKYVFYQMGYVFYYDFMVACLRFLFSFLFRFYFRFYSGCKGFLLVLFGSALIGCRLDHLSACWSPGWGWAAEQLRGDILVVGRCMWLILRKLGDGLLVLRA